MSQIIKNTFLILFFLSICIVFNEGTYAQGRQNYLGIANEAYDRGNYQQALEYYKNLLGDNTDSSLNNYPYYPTYRGFGFISFNDIKTIQYKISECYRNLYDYENWLAWAGKAKALNDKDFQLAQFYYAQALQQNGKYLQAIEEYREFNSQITSFSPKYNAALRGVQSCQFAIEYMKKPDSLTVIKLKDPINATGSSFSPLSLPGNKFFYTSSIDEMITDTVLNVQKTKNTKAEKDKDKKKLNSKNSKPPKITKKNLSKRTKMSARIFMTEKTNSGFAYPGMLDIPLEKGFSVGTPSFSKDMRRMFYTRWEGSSTEGEMIICFSRKLSNGEWSKPKELNKSVNIPKSKSMMPFYIEDLGLLLFSSDRQGGQGGLDLWTATVDSLGNASNVSNLGKEINTEENETTPFYDLKNKVLYFSSNGHIGLGGYDIFRCEGEIGKWKKVENMGYPINSSRQDQYFNPDPDGQIVYLASDRTDCKKGCSGSSCFSIYRLEVPDFTLRGIVYDFDTRKPISDAEVVLKTTESPEKDTSSFGTNSNENGQFRSGMKKNSTYAVTPNKKGYEPGTAISVTTKGLKRIGISIDTFVVLRKIIVLKGLVAESDKFKPLPGVAVTLFDNNTGQELGQTTTDRNGNFFFDVKRDKDFRIMVKLSGYLNKEIRTTSEGATDTVKVKRILMDKIVLDKPIVIENIFYDFNKASLRPESYKPLDSLANLLKANPGLVVEIGAHTDSKGDDKYNLKLSDKRAASVVEYLVRRGIKPSLLQSKGYGESKPMVPNETDGKDNPENRQINRRTEFKVVKIMDQPSPTPAGGGDGIGQ